MSSMPNMSSINTCLLFFVGVMCMAVLYEAYIYKFHRLHLTINGKSKSKSGNITYNQCNNIKLGDTIKKVFDKNGVVKDVASWDLYVPCGYNYVEGELETMNKIKPHQRIFAISGCDKIASKNNLWEILRNTYGREEASKIMPETYIIGDKGDMKIFKANYQEGNLYVVKKNVQRKEGIVITGDYNKIMRMCNKQYKVIQEYARDLYILKRRKINIRLYLLVICFNGKVGGYLYNQGKCIYTNKDYKEGTDAEDREVHLTSVNLDMDIYKTHPETLEDLEKYLGSKDYKLLWNNTLKIMKQMMKATEKHICFLDKMQKAVAFQVFGGDIIFDKSFNPYLLELNKGPSMKYMSDIDMKMKDQLTRDMFTFVGLTNNELEGNFIKLN